MLMLETIKLILGIAQNDTSLDDILSLMIEDTTIAVLNYCNINKLPKQLEYIIREIVVNKFKAGQEDNIQSIKRGDTQITYTEAIDTNCFTDKQRYALNRFRKITIR